MNLHNTYPYEEVLADAVEAIAIARALNNERVRLLEKIEYAEGVARTEMTYKVRWRAYATAWEAWCDGEGTTRPQRQAYGL